MKKKMEKNDNKSKTERVCWCGVCVCVFGVYVCMIRRLWFNKHIISDLSLSPSFFASNVYITYYVFELIWN